MCNCNFNSALVLFWAGKYIKNPVRTFYETIVSFQVLGRYESGLYPHAKQPKNLCDDRGSVEYCVGRLPSAPNSPIQGSPLHGPHPEEAVHGQPGRKVPDIRYKFHILRPFARHLRAVLEDLPNSAETNPTKTRTERASECGESRKDEQ